MLCVIRGFCMYFHYRYVILQNVISLINIYHPSKNSIAHTQKRHTDGKQPTREAMNKSTTKEYKQQGPQQQTLGPGNCFCYHYELFFLLLSTL